MSINLQTLIDYLGKDASVLLADSPFNDWTFEESIENDLDKPLIDFIFADNGIDFVCDEDGKINSIFIYSDNARNFTAVIQDFPLTMRRQRVIELLGAPSRSAGKFSDPILGEYGPWDRFDYKDYSLHVEYSTEAEIVNKLTLMRADVVP